MSAVVGKMGAYLRYQILEPHYPLIGVEITEEALHVMKLKKMKKRWKLVTFDNEPLDEGTLKVSPLELNVTDISNIVSHMQALWSRNKIEDKQLSVLIPDKAIIIFIIKLEHTTSRKEADRLIQWKLRKSVPFPIEMAKVVWMVMSTDPVEKKSNILVALIKKDILEQYEKIAKSVDASIALVDIPFLNFFNYVRTMSESALLTQKDFLIINHNGAYLTMGLFSGGDLSLFKCRMLIHKPTGNAGEYKNEILKELHPLVMYYFDQIGGNSLKTVFIKAGNDALPAIIQERYGFTIERPTLKDKIVIESPFNLSIDDLDSHLPLAGLLLGRRLG